jgi:hypothetical protein
MFWRPRALIASILSNSLFYQAKEEAEEAKAELRELYDERMGQITSRSHLSILLMIVVF